MPDNYVTIKFKADTKTFEKQIAQVEDDLKQIDFDLAHAKELKLNPRQIQEYTAKAEKLRNKLVELRKKQQEINNQGFTNVKNSLDNVGNGMEKVVKKVTRWGLALFGIRSMYNFIRQSASTISQYDKQMAADMEYIRYALAMTLKPIIKWILDAVHTLMSYINYIWEKWFGKALFADAGAKSFADANSQAKKLQKTLAGFDEMNVVSDNTDAGSGFTMPGFDLSKTGDVPIPWWVDLIANNKDTILNIGKVFAGLFVASKVAGWVTNIGKLIGTKSTGLNGILTALMAIAAYELIKIDIVLVKKAIEEYDELQDSVENVAKSGEKAIKNEKKWKEESTKSTTSTEKLNNIFQHYSRNIQLNTQFIEGNRNAIKDLGFWEGIVDSTIPNGTFAQNTKAIAENSVEIKENIGNLKNMAIAGNLTNDQEEQFKEILKNIIPKLEDQKDGLVKGSDAYNNLEGAINTAKETLNQFEDGTIDSQKGMDNLIEKIQEYSKTKIEEKEAKIGINIDTSETTTKLNQLQQDISRILSNIKIPNFLNNDMGKILAKPIVNALPEPIKGMVKQKLGLAKGGIVNMPGRGVPVGGAIAGEVSREGVIPLTDSQQMSLLGEAIGKYINVNLTNITELDGRQIARKVEQINQNNNFVLNR